MTDESLLWIFREEAGERLARMSVTLLAAERGGAAAAEIDELFRDVHSIKGSAGMLGFDDVGVLAGTIETALEATREQGALPAALVPALLRAMDAIRAAIDGDPSDLADAGRALEAPYAEALAPEAEPDATAPSVPAPPDDDAPLPVRAAPLPAAPRAVRVPTARLDGLLDTVGETALHRSRLDHLVGPRGVHDEALEEELEHGRVLASELYDTVLELRTLPLESIVGSLSRAVRDVGAEAGRRARLETEGTETALDRTLLDGLTETLVHLLRNSVSHGIEPAEERIAAGKPPEGRILVSAERRGSRVAIIVADDGRGVSPEVLARAEREGSLVDVLSEAGFSTATDVTDLAGRGVGLDAVRRHVESLGGSLLVDSQPGAGTQTTLLLPLTLAVDDVLVFARGDARFSLPLASVDAVVRRGAVHRLGREAKLDVDGEAIPLVDIADALGSEAPVLDAEGPAIVVRAGDRRLVVACDRLLGDQQAIVKSLGPLLALVPGYLGVAQLGDGELAPLLEPARLVHGGTAAPVRVRAAQVTAEPPRPTVLVVDDQPTVRELERTILESAGYRVVTAGNGREALAVLDRDEPIACIVSDVQMPVMDGLEMLEAIRARPAFASLPVVIVTSRQDDEARARGAEAGADAWVVKSRFDQQALLDTVARLLAPA